jgi:hypothetical protein
MRWQCGSIKVLGRDMERMNYMKDGKFKSLIVDVYNKSKDGNLVGILYGATSTYGFSDLININEFVEVGNPSMLYIKSKLTNTEADVYEWELDDYKIKTSESTIYVKIKGKEIPIMY